MNSPFHQLDHGINCIDTQHMREDFVAAYLIEEDGRAAFIDSGCYLSVPTLLLVLEEKKIPRENVDFIILTHIHLDHAGGAGELLKYLPNAKIYVHEFGARHLIDPSKLRSGVIAVYGELFFKQFLGDLIPSPQEKVVVVKDGDSVQLGNRTLKFYDTPGHARHHICIWDDKSQSVFSGDTLGVSYREFDSEKGVLIFPPTTPIQFDPQAWIQTINRLDDLKPKYAFLTHFCQIEWSRSLANDLIERIKDFVEIAKKCANDKNRHQKLKALLLEYLLEVAANHGTKIGKDQQTKLFKGDLEICAQGLGVWLDQESQK